MIAQTLHNDIYVGIYRFHKSRHGKDVDGSRYTIHRQDQIVVGSSEKPNHPSLRRPFFSMLLLTPCFFVNERQMHFSYENRLTNN